MRLAAVLHLYYQDLVVDLVRRVCRIEPALDLFVTGPIAPAVADELAKAGGNVTPVAAPAAGRDVGPFLAALPHILAGGYDLLVKLHTKRGRSGYAADWRRACLDALIRSPADVAAIVAMFQADPLLAMAGPAPLYLSAAAEIGGNRRDVGRLARAAFPGRPIPADWGFFAGTMFWARPGALAGFAGLADLGLAFEADGEAALDGQLAHAAERAFGLAPAMAGGLVGLIDTEVAPVAIAVRDAGPVAPGERIELRLARLRERRLRALPMPDADTALPNPLLHYLRAPDGRRHDPNPLLHEAWYLRSEDGEPERRTALAAYRADGPADRREPSPGFARRLAAAWRSGLARSGAGPLADLLAGGDALAGEDATAPAAATLAPVVAGAPMRQAADPVAEAAMRRRLAALPASVRDRAERLAIAVVALAGDDGAPDAAGLRSVGAQTHRRVRVLASGAQDRAAALAGTDADLVAWLTPGAVWRPDFLALMAAFIVADGLDGALALAELRDESGRLAFVGGDPGAGGAPRGALAALCLRRDLVTGPGDGSEAALTAAAPRACLPAGARLGFLPVAGVTMAGAAAHDLLAALRQPGQRAEHPGERVVIRSAAPLRSAQSWGDHHFATGLAEAIARRGGSVVVRCREEWREPETGPYALIVLRGPAAGLPEPGVPSILWNISHPEDVSFEEMEAFDLVYVASETYAAFLATFLRVPVRPLLQATDPHRFRPHAAGRTGDLVFVGNWRTGGRPIVDWALAAGLTPRVYGASWEDRLPPAALVAPGIDNARLPGLYGSAGAVLNDHWPAMRDYGFVGNRLFDAVAAGGRAISDGMPAIGRLFGPVVRTVDGPASLAAATAAPWPDEAELAAAAGRVARDHSFDRRAATLAADIGALVAGRPPATPAFAARPGRRVTAVLRRAGADFDEDAFVRVIGPLTQDCAGDLAFRVFDRLDPAAAEADVCIVGGRAAVPDGPEEAAFAAVLRRSGCRLVLDGGRFGLPSGMLASHAEQFWLPAPAGESSGRVACLPDGLDARAWKDYRPDPRPAARGRPLRLFILRRGGEETGPVIAGLDALVADRGAAIAVTMVGPPFRAGRPWLDSAPVPPAVAAWPRFARWLRRFPDFDAAIILPGQGAADARRTLLVHAALGVPSLSAGLPPRDPALGTVAVGDGPTGWAEAVAALLDAPDETAARGFAAQGRLWQSHGADRVAVRQMSLLGLY